MTSTVIFPWPPKACNPNARVHHMAHAAAKKKYRQECYLLTLQAGIHGLTCPCRLLIEFYPPDRRKRDIDNMLASIKAGLDGWSEAVGVDDSVFNDCQLVKHKQIGGMVRLSVLPTSCNAGGTP